MVGTYAPVSEDPFVVPLKVNTRVGETVVKFATNWTEPLLALPLTTGPLKLVPGAAQPDAPAGATVV